ncbi:MAG: tetratricopeptide repeat protein [Rhodobacteraceae bacterium]|nr:tetratricopeptide repeat protein [Paracoccaceae bacterium]
MEQLFAQLQSADESDWKSVENKILKEYSKSGSVAMDMLLERGRQALKKGNLGDAIGIFSTVIDHAPGFAEAWNARATAFFMADRYNLSLDDIEQVLALSPRHFGAMLGLGMILERLNRPRDALKAFQEVLKVHPHRPDAKRAVERLKTRVEGVAL